MSDSKENSKLGVSVNSMEELYQKADRFLLVVLWVHLPVVSFFFSYGYGTWKQALLASSFLVAIGTISYIFSRGTLGHRILNGILLLSYSIIMITIQFGRLEMHFHIFCTLPFLLLYRDWRVLPPAAGLIAIQHVIFNYCQTNNIEAFGFPLVVFNYGQGWDIVLLHAFFVVIQTSILIYFSEYLKKQHLDLQAANSKLEEKVLLRTKDLQKEKEKIESYHRALNQVAIISYIDETGKIVDVNEKYQELSGFSKEEVLLNETYIQYSKYHPQDYLDEMWNSLKDNRVWRGEMCHQGKNGEQFWLDSAIVPLKNAANEETFLAIRFDITDRKKDEQTILSQREQIISQSKLSALGEMAGGIAHEINNPLAIINATLYSMRKMIQRGMTGSEPFLDAMEDIEKTVIRITKIIVGLRNISRDPSKEDFEECRVEEFLDDILALCTARLKSNGVEFETVIGDETLKQILSIKRVQLSQVIINLISNAYDEISEKDNKWIKLVVEYNPESTLFKVIDSGLGIPSEIQEKIFQPFFTTKDIGKGTGIGLSLSHSIVISHKGRLYVDNSAKHTTFVVDIPHRK